MHYRPTILLILSGGLGLDSMPDDKILLLVSRLLQRSWSRDLVTKVLVLGFFNGLDNKSGEMDRWKDRWTT